MTKGSTLAQLEEIIIEDFKWDQMREICSSCIFDAEKVKYQLVFSSPIVSDLVVGMAPTRKALADKRYIAQYFVEGIYDIVLMTMDERKAYISITNALKSFED